MAKIQSTFVNMVSVLTGITFVAAGLLGTVNHLTQVPIERVNKEKQKSAVEAVVPTFDNDPIADKYTVTDEFNRELNIFPAKKGGETVGAAVETYSKNGFGGEIKLMVGFDKEGAIVNYSVLEHKETPGLGSKMDEWFKTNKNKQSILGKKVPAEGLKVTKDGGDIDAITASTITSRAFMDAINRAYKSYTNSHDGYTSASEQQ